MLIRVPPYQKRGMEKEEPKSIYADVKRDPNYYDDDDDYDDDYDTEPSYSEKDEEDDSEDDSMSDEAEDNKTAVEDVTGVEMKT